MLDYNPNGKIICGPQPQITPTIDVSDTISSQMGVPIFSESKTYDSRLSSSNYYVQYNHKGGQHIILQKNLF